jgi:hypothetical protein
MAHGNTYHPLNVSTARTAREGIKRRFRARSLPPPRLLYESLIPSLERVLPKWRKRSRASIRPRTRGRHVRISQITRITSDSLVPGLVHACSHAGCDRRVIPRCPTRTSPLGGSAHDMRSFRSLARSLRRTIALQPYACAGRLTDGHSTSQGGSCGSTRDPIVTICRIDSTRVMTDPGL